jgi:hypothetical protein
MIEDWPREELQISVGGVSSNKEVKLSVLW